MGSKKHKKESKKKKHRSRSRSPLDNEERERKRHKKHKDRKKDRSPDVEEVPVDSHLVKESQGGNGKARSHSRSRSQDRDRRMREQRHAAADLHREKSTDRVEKSPMMEPSGAAQESLSIEETNRLRAKLGLKPLEVNEKPADDGKIKDDLGEFYHKPAMNIAQQKKTDKLKQKLEERKEKRNIEKKLKTATLAEGSDDEDALAWVQRSREMDKQKRDAAKRAAMLDEMDEVFGLSALTAAPAPGPAYTPRHLQGLRVAHHIDQLADEQETILTLADKDVLAEDDEDVLVNVNMVDEERYKKSIEERKKARSGYQAYDEEAELEAALGRPRPLLAKYDAHIEGAAPAKPGFRIGDDAAIEAERFKEMMRRERMAGGPDKRLESLALPAPRLASDYMDEHELNAKFKKSKRKGKIRKKPKAEPIDVDDYDAGNAPLDTDDTDVKPEQLASGGGGAVLEDEEETEPDTELQAALARARRLRQQRERALPKVEEILERVKEEGGGAGEGEGEEEGPGMVLDATAEFCRTLGDIPTYGQAGNRDHHAEILDMEVGSPEPEPAGGAEGGAWARVEGGAEGGAAVGASAAAAAVCLEPRLGAGVAGALALALSKGYLERAGAGPAPRAPRAPHLLASRYSIEDKAAGAGPGEEERRRPERDHRTNGPLHDFREKHGFRPDVKLEYVDDDGRPLAPKEAFRYLSHKFHGKGPGKNKQEKRIKKAVQEGLMKKMSSTDTPLNTLQMLQDKQRETQSPYIVLSGTKRDNNN